jgi:hypothetical protein
LLKFTKNSTPLFQNMDILNLYIMFVKKKKILLRLRNLINIVPKYGHLKSLYCVCQKKNLYIVMHQNLIEENRGPLKTI